MCNFIRISLRYHKWENPPQRKKHADFTLFADVFVEFVRKASEKMANINSMSQSNGKVYLNVYDLHENNDMLHPIGLGLFHSGVQVGRTEYTFGKSNASDSACVASCRKH